MGGDYASPLAVLVFKASPNTNVEPLPDLPSQLQKLKALMSFASYVLNLGSISSHSATRRGEVCHPQVATRDTLIKKQPPSGSTEETAFC